MRALALIAVLVSGCAMSVTGMPAELCDEPAEAPHVCQGFLPSPCEAEGGTLECEGSGEPPVCDAGNPRCAPGDALVCAPAACTESP